MSDMFHCIIIGSQGVCYFIIGMPVGTNLTTSLRKRSEGNVNV